MKKLKGIIFVFIASLFFTGCGEKEVLESVQELEGQKYQITNKETNNVLLELTDEQKILLELYPDIAPITVKNFKKLVKEDFYDNLIFHRVEKDFVIQAGDGTAQGRSASTIKGEFEKNGVKNDLKHERGVISMARTSVDKNSASSQFFIMLEDNASLDGDYAAFGRVLKGLETVDSIGKVMVDKNDKPLKDITIKSVEFVRLNNE